MRMIVACSTLLLLGACSDAPPPASLAMGTDVPCLHHQDFDLGVPFKEAILICHSPKPDLTGNGALQADALAAKVPFTIRPAADKRIKEANADTLTGSLIPSTHDGEAFRKGPIFPVANCCGSAGF